MDRVKEGIWTKRLHRIMRPTNVIMLPTNEEEVFYYWMKVLYPFHHMPDKEVKIASKLLEYRYKLQDSTKDLSVLDILLFSSEVKSKMIEELGMSYGYFHSVLSKFRDKGFLIGDTINPKFIPRFDNVGNLSLLIMFKKEG